MTEPSPSAIRRQVNLPFSKAFSIALKGITIRFWRSLITAYDKRVKGFKMHPKTMIYCHELGIET